MRYLLPLQKVAGDCASTAESRLRPFRPTCKRRDFCAFCPLAKGATFAALAPILVLLMLAGCETPSSYPPPSRGPAKPQSRPARPHTLSSATQALVNQSRSQTAAGNYAAAASSIERALRIDPDNPLLWIELGKVRQAEGNYVQADAMARKALVSAGGDPKAQFAAWKLIAQSLRSRGRNGEAREAEQRAAQASTN
jgi:tetratricopeptide (TPR) repeat protein